MKMFCFALLFKLKFSNFDLFLVKYSQFELPIMLYLIIDLCDYFKKDSSFCEIRSPIPLRSSKRIFE